ncbi:MAG: Trk system potassium transporter TrkA [Candidatus Omnitrophica bacterium]|nr:Trk system potassium transporter TrkA [Candidatus Omnitrophota bacterium]
MKIVIAGAGIIGANLAKSLTEENHEVYLIERNEETAQKVHEKLDVKVVVGNSADPNVLKKVFVSEADLVIAVTTSDETNLVVCSLAAKFGAKRRIARVRNAALSKTLVEAGLNRFDINEIINPEEVAAQAIVKTIETPGACEVADFAQGKILLRAFDVPHESHLCKLAIEELRQEDFPWPFLIIAVNRKGEVFIPKGKDTLLGDDRIYVLLPAASLGEFLMFMDPNIRRSKKVVIYGGSETGERVAAALHPHVPDIILLEEKQELAEELAGRLEDVRVINGSGSESDILKECGIEVADAFVAVSDSDHTNLVSAVLAKKMGAKETIITNQQPDFLTIMNALDIDAIINPRLLAVEQILRLVRGRGILSVRKFIESEFEVLEFIAEQGAAITKAELKKISFPKNTIVGAVCDGDEGVLATGDTRIKQGQRAIVFCREIDVKKLQALFTRKKII